MPLPKREQGESKAKFLDRCMSNSSMTTEFPDPVNRFAVCNTQARKDAMIALQSFNDYPEAVVNNAKRGIALNEKVGNQCALRTGKLRAQQLANKEAISIETIKRMKSFLSRAESYYEDADSSEDCGFISYLLWGGKAGLRWATSKLKELE